LCIRSRAPAPQILDANPHTDIVLCAFFMFGLNLRVQGKGKQKASTVDPGVASNVQVAVRVRPSNQRGVSQCRANPFHQLFIVRTATAAALLFGNAADLLRLAVGPPVLDCAFVTLFFLIPRCRHCCRVVDYTRTQLLVLSHGTPCPPAG
jgi:hypothetical protein